MKQQRQQQLLLLNHRQPALSIVLFLILTISTITESVFAMTWTHTWKDILSGGSPRWKVDDVALKQHALSYISNFVTSLSPDNEQRSLNILCPLAGDDPFVHQAWLQGHSVTSIDLVPDAVAAMRKQFISDTSPLPTKTSENQWSVVDQSNGGKLWNHSNGRATLYEGDMLEKRPELVNKFDAVYDKDSFGALDKSMRQSFCQRIADYTKDDAIVYVEVKHKDADHPGRQNGPPYHVEKDDLMELTSFGECFDYIASLGQVYDIGMDGMSQTAHVLKRKARDSPGSPQ
jgi:hypothetical protein